MKGLEKMQPVDSSRKKTNVRICFRIRAIVGICTRFTGKQTGFFTRLGAKSPTAVLSGGGRSLYPLTGKNATRTQVRIPHLGRRSLLTPDKRTRRTIPQSEEASWESEQERTQPTKMLKHPLPLWEPWK